MKKENLEHLIRAAAEITNQYEFIVIGSQSILGSVCNPPEECLISQEADIYAVEDESLSDLIDGSIGEGSMFHDTFHYYAQGVASTTAVLPIGWKERLNRLQSPQTNGRVAYCLDIVDLFCSKCVANREKDKVFNKALLTHGVVQTSDALKRCDLLPLPPERIVSVKALVLRLQSEINHPLKNNPKR